jgi:RND family efflux transporter MFP subunit
MSRGLFWSGSVLVVLAAAAAGVVYLEYPDLIRPPTVTTGVAVLGPVSEAVYGTGTVEPERWAKVVPLQRRRVVELCRCEGQAVKVGQILGRQDDAEEVSALHELEINNEQLARDLDRAKRDRDKNEAAKTEYEQRSTQFEQSQSRISAQKVRIDSLVLRAPLDGMVLRRDGEVGEIVGPTDVLFWVGPPTPMQVVAEINEEEITRITVGQKAFLRSEAFSAQALRATVSQITPKGDPTRKTFRVYLRLPPDTPLRIGMTVEVNIIYREKTAAVVVPSEAVASNAVQVVSGGKIQRVPVSVGIRGSRNVEVIGDVSRDTTVLSPARADLADGTRVRVANVAAKPAEAPVDVTPTAANSDPVSRREPAAIVTSSADSDSAVISAAISAHVDSVVSDARRNVGKYR